MSGVTWLDGQKSRRRFFSSHGAPCWHCKSTGFGYVVDDAVTYIGACCLECGYDNMFHPKTAQTFVDGETIAAAHREAVT